MGLLGSDGIAGVLQRSFGLDYRSLALYRIMLGLVIMGDLADRAHDLHNFYTDAGVNIALSSFLMSQVFIRAGSQWSMAMASGALMPSFFSHLSSGSIPIL